MIGAASAFLGVIALREFVKDVQAGKKDETTTVDLNHNPIIICPDCGKQVAFKNRCPKCHSESWMPAGAHEREKPWQRSNTSTGE